MKNPAGMQDRSIQESTIKQKAIRQLEKLFQKNGYLPIETPVFETLATYEQAFGYIDANRLFTLVDQEGTLCALRMDMTVPIARVVSTKLEEDKVRVYYAADTFHKKAQYSGLVAQSTDVGIEAFGQIEDENIIQLAIEALKTLKLEARLELSDSRFLNQACQILNLDEVTKHQLIHLVDTKNRVALKRACQNLSEQAKTFFLALPLIGDDLEQLKTYCFDEKLIEIVNEYERIQQRYQVLVDLSKCPHQDYYTGLIFEAFVSGVGSSILSGGRYDELAGRFGKDLPACGFAIKIDRCLSILKEKEV